MAFCLRGFQLIMDPVVHRWRRRSVLGDLARGAAGTLACLAAALSFEPLSFGQMVFALLTLLFASYLASAAMKLASAVTIDQEGITLVRPILGQTRIAWTDMPSFNVRHFRLGQLQRKSLVDVKLSTSRSTILIDDGLDDFQSALTHCWKAARAHGIGVSETTLANLAANGCQTAATGQHG